MGVPLPVEPAVEPEEDRRWQKGRDGAAEEAHEGIVAGGVAKDREVGEGRVDGQDDHHERNAGGPGPLPRDEAHGLRVGECVWLPAGRGETDEKHCVEEQQEADADEMILAHRAHDVAPRATSTTARIGMK